MSRRDESTLGLMGPEDARRALTVVGLAGLLIFGAVVVWDSFYVAGPGERVVTFNKVSGDLETTDPGLHFKLPLLESRTAYNVRGQLYTTTAWGASKDLQDVHAEVAITYHPETSAVADLHVKYGRGYADVVLAPAVQEVVKATTARYNADELISQRVAVKEAIVSTLRERLALVNVTIEQVDLKDFDFSDSFNAAIEAKVTAEQKALEEQNRLETVRFQALQKEATASGTANATRIEAQGQADAARIISEQLTRDPSYLEFVKLQRWDGRLPTVTAGASAVSLLVQPPTNLTQAGVAP